MRNGCGVCANACKCQALFPKKFPRPATCNFRVATLLSLETFAVYSSTSPALSGSPVSTGDAALFESAGKTDFTAAAFAGFSAEGASRKPGGSADTTSGRRCSPRGWSHENAPASQPSTATPGIATAGLTLLLFCGRYL